MAWVVERCPACGKTINQETDEDQMYCSHCGSRMVRKENNKVKIAEISQDAKIKQAQEYTKQEEERTKQIRITNTHSTIRTLLWLSPILLPLLYWFLIMIIDW